MYYTSVPLDLSSSFTDWRLMEYHRESMYVRAIIYRTRSPDNDNASLEFLLVGVAVPLFVVAVFSLCYPFILFAARAHHSNLSLLLIVVESQCRWLAADWLWSWQTDKTSVQCI